jgi:hypothetical protein
MKLEYETHCIITETIQLLLGKFIYIPAFI